MLDCPSIHRENSKPELESEKEQASHWNGQQYEIPTPLQVDTTVKKRKVRDKTGFNLFQ
jgi:hypothetical protein